MVDLERRSLAATSERFSKVVMFDSGRLKALAKSHDQRLGANLRRSAAVWLSRAESSTLVFYQEDPQTQNQVMTILSDCEITTLVIEINVKIPKGRKTFDVIILLRFGRV
jgi:hypothetical protein